MFSTCLDKFMPFSSNLKLSSADSFSIEESKICRLGKGYLVTTQSSLFMNPRKKGFENLVGKGENAGCQHFLLFPQCSLKQISFLV